MKKYLLFVISFFYLFQVSAEVDKVIAIVNDRTITHLEFIEEKKMFIMLNRMNKVEAKQQESFDKAVLESLIQNHIFLSAGEAMGINASDEEIEAAIKTIEIGNKMKNKALESMFKANNIDISSYRNKIRGEIIREKIISELLSETIAVSQNEIDSAIIENSTKDVEVYFKVFTSINNNDNAYKAMQNLRNKLKNTKDIKPSLYKSFAVMEDKQTKLNELDFESANVVKNLSVKEGSIIKTNNGFKLFFLERKVVLNVSPEENKYVTSFIGNKRLLLKAQQYYETLRKKSYVKIFK